MARHLQVARDLAQPTPVDDRCEIRDVRASSGVLQNDVVANMAILLAALAVGLSAVA